MKVMKKFINILAATIIGCAMIVSCEKLDNLYNLATSLLESPESGEYESSDQYVFTIVNNSSDDMVWYVPYNTGISPVKDDSRSYIHYISPRQKTDYEVYLFSSKEPLLSYGKDDVLTIYFFRTEDYDDYSWKELVNNQMWKDVYFLTVDDILALNKVIEYPKP